MFLVPINYLAILVSAIVAMAVGFAWYGPLFGTEWMKLVGMTREKMKKAQEGMTTTYGISFGLSLLMAYTLAHFIWFTAPGSTTFLIGIKTAIWAWTGFVATIILTRYLYSPEKKPIKLYIIDGGYNLVTLLVMGAILGAWW